jgi:hypothetical protein
LKTFVEFRSSKFPPYDGEEEEINPDVWGKRLAEYLTANLTNYGIETEDIIGEDWGWYIPVVNKGFRLAICCGHQYGDDDQFLCFTDPKDPVFRRFIRKIDGTKELEKLTSAIREIFASDDEIRDIEWYTREEFENPTN